jgi:hypothetical protein
MKHFLSVVILIAAFAVSAFAQAEKPASVLSDKQWNDLYAALQAENWDTAAKLSSDYLRLIRSEDQAKTLARLRYMYLYAAAGRVSQGKMTYPQLARQVKPLIGKEIALPFHPINQGCRFEFNTICRTTDRAGLLITATNQAGTTIHAFEYIQPKEKFDLAANDGKFGAVFGTIDSIAPNPKRSRLLIMRIFISAADIRVKDKL